MERCPAEKGPVERTEEGAPQQTVTIVPGMDPVDVPPTGPGPSAGPDLSVFHQETLVVDVHTDVHLDLVRSRANGESRVLARRHLPGWRAGGVDAVVLNTIPKFGPDPYPYHTTPVHNALYMLDCLHRQLEESPDELRLVTTAEEIRQTHDEGRIGIMIGIEGSEALGDDLSLLRSYHRLGVRVLTLNWHQRNQVGDGVSEPSASGLSNWGRQVVSEANRLGVLVDVSHSGPRTVEDVLALSLAPVVASHSNSRHIHDHERNLTDDQVRAVAARGGLVGVTFLARFVADGTPHADRVFDHIEHLVGIVGPERVGIGTDFTTGGEDLIIASRRVAGPGQPTSDASIPYATGLDRYELLGNLTSGLFERGFDASAVSGILGANYLRVLRAVEEAAG